MQLRNRFVGDSGNDDRPSKRRRTDSETVQFQSRSTTLTARQLTDASSFAPIERKITRRAAGRGRKSATLPDETAIPWPTGLFAHLPYEIIEKILELCSPKQMGMLQTTCSYFTKSLIIDKFAQQKLKDISRAKGMKPNAGQRETWLMLWSFVSCQSDAAAQATAVAFGSYHTAALLIPINPATGTTHPRDHHALYTFGRGFHGQLGTNSYENENRPSCISLGYKPSVEHEGCEEETQPAVVACGNSHTCSISRRGELFTWGLASSGELGHAAWTPIEVPVPRQCFLSSNPALRIVSVAAGANHTLAISETGSLWSCGRGRQGQLGHGSFNDETSLVLVDQLKNVRIVSAAAGVCHSMALASDGSLFTWGDGRYGQLGHAQLQTIAAIMPQQAVVMPVPAKVSRLDPMHLAPADRITAIASGGNHCMALTVGGTLWGFGRNKHGALGTGDTEDKWKPSKVEMAGPSEQSKCIRAVQVVCGASHTLALTSNHGVLEVRGCGHNSWGQLGMGDRRDRHRMTRVAKAPSGISAVQAGDDHSGAVVGDGSLWVWGRGDCGQLAVGDDRSKWSPTMVKGFKVVHPDRTLRRNKRNQPRMRPMKPAGAEKTKGEHCFGAPMM